jgi:hypothetical protein
MSVKCHLITAREVHPARIMSRVLLGIGFVLAMSATCQAGRPPFPGEPPTTSSVAALSMAESICLALLETPEGANEWATLDTHVVCQQSAHDSAWIRDSSSSALINRESDFMEG